VTRPITASRSRVQTLRRVALYGLGVLVLLALTVLVDRSLPYDESRDLAISAVQRAMLVGLVAVIAAALSVVTLQPAIWRMGALLLWIMLLVPLDSYSWGFSGGISGIHPAHPWQRGPAAASFVLLLSAVVLTRMRRWADVRAVLIGEISVFLITNAYYLLRDGPRPRFFEGTPASPMPLILLVIGTVARIYCLTARTEPQSSKP